MEEQPKVGLGVLIFKEGKVLLGKRKNAHGAGEYATPGGHVDFGETLEECARRELREETGLEIENLEVICVSNILLWGKHYLDIGFRADWKSGEAMNLEPDKCEGWEWYDPASPPAPLMVGASRYLDALKTGKIFYAGTISEAP